MSVGPSGRIVIEVSPELKRELHSALVLDGQTLKNWFVSQAESFVKNRQPARHYVNSTPTKKQYSGSLDSGK